MLNPRARRPRSQTTTKMPSRDTLPQRIRDNLFRPVEEMERMGLRADVRERVVRCRRLYLTLMDNPTMSDRDLRKMARALGAGDTVALEDVRAVKVCVGSLQQLTRDWYEWLFIQRIEEAVAMAREQGDAKALVAAAAALGKYTRLDHEENREADYRQIGIQPFVVTEHYEPLTDEKRRALFRDAQEAVEALEH